MTEIVYIKGREVLDSRGNPTVEVEVILESGGTGPRIPPRGSACAELMIVVAHPEEQDQDSLLSGTEGRLLSGFLRAAGIAPERTYCASLLPRHAVADELAAGTLAAVPLAERALQQHVVLATGSQQPFTQAARLVAGLIPELVRREIAPRA